MPRPVGTISSDSLGLPVRGGDAPLQRLPLCVDLDGTLVRTDTLDELLLAAIRDGRALLSLPGLLLRGKAALKTGLASQLSLDVASLPYDRELIEYLRAEREGKRFLVLATATAKPVADAIAEHLGLFDEVIATTPDANLRGSRKADVLCERFGEGGFAYAGNDSTDVSIWKRAGAGVIVGATSRVSRRARDAVTIEREFSGREAPTVRTVLKAMRVYQWSKNVLVFVPVITAGAMFVAGDWLKALTMFLAFSLVASSIYLTNDLVDLEADRMHPRKRLRPFASGALSLRFGSLMAPILAVAGFSLGALVQSVVPLAVYAVASTAYSFKLKEYPLVDVFTLAALYTLRIVGGGVASGHRISPWLLAFSSFFFFGLAMVKRVAELQPKVGKAGNGGRRGYMDVDIPLLQMLGICSSMIAALVLALFTQTELVGARYPHAYVLWALVPLCAFWQSRIWLATFRGYMQDDPIVYSAKDWVSRAVVLIGVAIVLLASRT